MIVPVLGLAQHKKLAAGITPGMMYYQGDLSGGAFPAGGTTHFTAAVDFSYELSRIFEISLGYTYGRISGDDALVPGHEERNLRFYSNINDIKLLVFTNINSIRRVIWPKSLMKSQHIPKSFSSPRLILGVGVLRCNPKARSENGRVYQLQQLGTEGQLIGGDYPEPYKRWQFNVKYGLGMGYYISSQIHVELQVIYTQTFTDYLDDVSGTYPDYNELMQTENGDITAYFTYGGRDGSKVEQGKSRGNASSNDGLITTGLKFTYIFTGDELRRWLNF